MKQHLEFVRENQHGGHIYSTLCGRASSEENREGINATGDKSKVTCKHCLAHMDKSTSWRWRFYVNYRISVLEKLSNVR